jgi:putative effector of murein hydrolase LrgA (UPF0299 family)
MLAVDNKAKNVRRVLWLLLTVSLALWAYLRLHLGLPGPVDALVLLALLAEAALVLGHRPSR